jgi:SulP family sulfate permease
LVTNGKIILLINPIEQPKYMMEKIDIIPDLIPKEQIFDSFENCLIWIKEHEKNKL